MTSGSCSGDFTLISAECNKLNDSPFNGCGISRSELIVECIFDSCMAPSLTNDFVCSTIEGYVSLCNEAVGETQISSWRTEDRCPLTCGENAHFESCTNSNCWPSVESCTVDQNLCENSISSCSEGCFCNTGFLRDGESCVAQTEENCQEDEVAENEQEIGTIDPCASDPCQNGGTCANNAGNNGYTCTCVNNYSGTNCEDAEEVVINQPWSFFLKEKKIFNQNYNRK